MDFIPFSRPHIDAAVIAEVNSCLLETGWLTSGPKVLAFEQEINALTGAQATICVNSWTSGAMLMLRWLGVGPGDEVIIPAYTYAATALCVLNVGATVVMVDVRADFTLDTEQVKSAITPRTKAIIPVDVGGWMADYDALFAVVNSPEIRAIFRPKSEKQAQLGRIFILADAAHSLGATYKNQASGCCADATVFSFHSVKNITTGEGGAIGLQLPDAFQPAEEYTFLKALALNGQTKSAYEKNLPGAWRYDIVAQGLKANMPDLCAAVGLAQIRQYADALLPERKHLFAQYEAAFSGESWAILPPFSQEKHGVSSAHLYLLRIAEISENQRDTIIQRVAEKGVGVNVHYRPLPMLRLFQDLGFRIQDYPQSYDLYRGEISLPLYNGLKEKAVERVVDVVKEAVLTTLF